MILLYDGQLFMVQHNKHNVILFLIPVASTSAFIFLQPVIFKYLKTIPAILCNAI